MGWHFSFHFHKKKNLLLLLLYILSMLVLIRGKNKTKQHLLCCMNLFLKLCLLVIEFRYLPEDKEVGFPEWQTAKLQAALCPAGAQSGAAASNLWCGTGVAVLWKWPVLLPSSLQDILLKKNQEIPKQCTIPKQQQQKPKEETCWVDNPRVTTATVSFP